MKAVGMVCYVVDGIYKHRLCHGILRNEKTTAQHVESHETSTSSNAHEVMWHKGRFYMGWWGGVCEG